MPARAPTPHAAFRKPHTSAVPALTPILAVPGGVCRVRAGEQEDFMDTEDLPLPVELAT